MYGRRLKKDATFGLESKIALGFIENQRALGFKVYQELDRCDLVMVKDGVVTAVEAKTVLNLKVFAQAFCHFGKADCVAILLPKETWRQDEHDHRNFAREICLTMGIGLYLVDWPWEARAAWEAWVPGQPIPPASIITQHSAVARPRTNKCWDRLFIPEAEDYSTAGGAGVKAFTEFRLWEVEVRKYVKEHPGLNIRELYSTLRPPGKHKRTGKPLVVHKQDLEIFSYNLRQRFTGFAVVPDPENNVYDMSRVYLNEDYDKKHWKTHWLPQPVSTPCPTMTSSSSAPGSLPLPSVLS